MLSVPDIFEPGRERSVLDLLTDPNAWAALASLTAAPATGEKTQ
jgi:hypothetical protein